MAFIRQYGFDGVDIDYEYPTSNAKAGNPLDASFSDARRGTLFAGYQTLMKTLREKLDRAGAADGRHYLLTVAAPASGWLLRGMEVMQVTQYLDYVNIMSYDLHGSWNQYVGGNAPLYDNGFDFTEGLAAVQLGGTWHYIDTAGRTRLSCPGCAAVKPFRGGKAQVVRNGERQEIAHPLKTPRYQ